MAHRAEQERRLVPVGEMALVAEAVQKREDSLVATPPRCRRLFRTVVTASGKTPLGSGWICLGIAEGLAVRLPIETGDRLVVEGDDVRVRASSTVSLTCETPAAGKAWELQNVADGGAVKR